MKVVTALKSILKAIGIVVALLLIAIAALFTYSDIDKEDTFYLLGAELQDPKWFETVQSHLKGVDAEKRFRERRKYARVFAHRIKPGNGIVFGYRHYSNGSVLAVDDEEYTKLTIWIADESIPEGRKLDLSDPHNALAVFSDGGSAWPDMECSGYISSGTVALKSSGSKATVRIAGTFVPTPNQFHSTSNWCRQKQFEQTFTAKPLTHGDLTTWLGKAGAHPYDETYR